MTVIIFLIVLAVLIFVHELGHFLFAKAFGIRVDAFALGFGPKIISWKGKETTYAINLIPFGGYVKIFGENPDEENTNGPERHRSFVHKAKWRQVLVLAAGVLFNFIFAWFLYIGVFTSGVTATTDGFQRYASDFSDPRIMVTYIEPNSPAEKAGIQAGDVILSVGGSTATQSIEIIQSVIDADKGKPLVFEYSRNKEIKTVQVAPVTGLVDGKYAIGIAMDNVAELHLPFFVSVWEGLKYTLTTIRDTATSLGGFVVTIFQGTADFSSISGPVGIAGIVGDAASLGLTYLVMITAIISINLGVINLIPFPALDGGRILFVIIEAIIRRRIPAKFTNIVNTVGFALLMILMVLVTYKDIAKLIK